MKRPLIWILVLFVASLGVAYSQEAQAVLPTLVFEDAAFDYLAHDVGYLHFSRDVAVNELTIRLTDTPELDGALPLRIVLFDPNRIPPSGLGFGLARFPTWEIPQSLIREMAGIKVWDQGIELPFRTDSHGFAELNNYFHELIPELGFAPGSELFAIDTYSYTCGCLEHANTHLRLTMNQSGKNLFVRLMLEGREPQLIL
ncbi:MAG: hypothetical protein JSV66_00840 [Trueperaceae bacterium]|nr:MAG: hypothetical protein JSV66_00840 [Trueperaceae bacterium]